MNTRRAMDVVGVIGALVGVVGFIVKPSWALLWAFLIVFGIAPLPGRAIRAYRRRRVAEHS